MFVVMFYLWNNLINVNSKITNDLTDNCYNDSLFKITEPLNLFVLNNDIARHILLTSTSVFVDVLVLFTIGNWIYKGRDYSLFLSIFSFYILRFCVLSLFQLRFPEGYAFDYAYIPSLTVSYFKTNDFFYSGHVGFPVIFLCDYYDQRKELMVVLCLLFVLIEGAMMILTRRHYSFDLLFGILMGHYIYAIMKQSIYSKFEHFLKANIPILSSPYFNNNTFQ